MVREGTTATFLESLEKTQMTRSYKMLVLLAMLHADRFPGELTLDVLTEHVRLLASRSAVLQKDLNVPLDAVETLKRKLIENPIKAWTGGKGTGGAAYFTREGEVFRTTFNLPADEREAFVGFVQELADWRLAEYLERGRQGGVGRDTGRDGFVCTVSHAGGRPMLFLPSRDDYPAIPSPGQWERVLARGQAYDVHFVKIAVNVLRLPGTRKNVLPELMREWFGEDAGRPGTGYQVYFARSDDGWTLEPSEHSSDCDGLTLGRSYMRAEIPPAFGLEFNASRWQQGFVHVPGHIFLLVTLEKQSMPQEHRYGDRFLSRDLFEWKSQNRHTRSSPAAVAMRDHEARNIAVHLLIRKSGKISGRAAPFISCGDVAFVDWEEERPITIRWRLLEPLSDALDNLFRTSS